VVVNAEQLRAEVRRELDALPELRAAEALLPGCSGIDVQDRLGATAAAGAIAVLRRAIVAAERLQRRWTVPIELAKGALSDELKGRLGPLKDAKARLDELYLGWARAEEVLAQPAPAEWGTAWPEAPDAEPEVTEYVPAPPTSIDTPAGRVSRVKRWTWEVEDINQVPIEYTKRVVDEPLVRAAIADGTRHIPGLRIYQHDHTAVGGPEMIATEEAGDVAGLG
jgi:hypothetical protein